MGSPFFASERVTSMPEKKTVPTQRVSVLRGVGPKTETLLQRMGIETLADLFAHYPLRFVTYPELTEIGALSADDAGTPVAVCAEPVRELVRRSGHSMQLCTGRFGRALRNLVSYALSARNASTGQAHRTLRKNSTERKSPAFTATATLHKRAVRKIAASPCSPVRTAKRNQRENLWGFDGTGSFYNAADFGLASAVPSGTLRPSPGRYSSARNSCAARHGKLRRCQKAHRI